MANQGWQTRPKKRVADMAPSPWSLLEADEPSPHSVPRGSAVQSASQWRISASREQVEEPKPLPQSMPRGSAEPPAEQWTIRASREQVEVPKHKLTHMRSLPLPFTIDGWIMGESYRQVQYAGHGQSKIVYRLTDKLVLKLCEERDQEPELFQALQTSGVYPKVHASCQCQVVNSAGRPVKTWHAWVIDYAKPLDQILKEYPAASKMCILGAIHAIVTAHSREHILSDNALFNFGMVQGNVVIIDAGSRRKSSKKTKGEFNRLVMRRFWSKAQTVVQPADLEVHREQWTSAGLDMLTVLQTYEKSWQKLRNAEQPGEVVELAMEVPNCTSSACPHVASVLDSLDTDTLDWLTETYLWGDVPRYGRSSDGYTRQQQDRVCTAAEKLEQLISETHAQRVDHCDNPAEDTLEEDKLKVILDSWKMITSNGCAQKHWSKRGT